jgi:hypothetical protein
VTRRSTAAAPYRTRAAAILAFSVALAACASAPGVAGATREQPNLREAIFVGNNWDGTAHVLRAGGNFGRIARINLIPDIDERMAEIATDPVRLGYFLGIRELVGEGNDQFADDLYSTHDGRLLIVSRPSLADVVAIRLRTGRIVWRFPVEGQRSDHMGISPNGRHVAVSASTANLVHILNVRTGEEVGRFPSGDTPHENVFSENGRRIYHASIGLVYTPADEPELDSTKGERYFQIVQGRRPWNIIERIDMGEKLEEAGHPNMASAVRPIAISANERWAYFQVSFFHGFVEYNFKRDRVTRIARLPLSDEAREMPREQYLLDSAHHGLALSGDGTRLCVAGTMSDYAAIVSRRNFRRYKLIHGGKRPYWSTTTTDGENCLLSWSGSDRISVISYDKRKEIARVPVGDHPQRVRMGFVRESWFEAQR